MENFESLNEVETTVEDTKEEKKGVAKSLNKRKKEAFVKKAQDNPQFIEELNRLSDTLEVVNALAHPNIKGVIKGDDAEDGSRTLEPVIGIVGYTLLNKGKEPLKYLTESFKKDENGKYVGEQVERVAKPGEKFILSKKYFTILTSAAAFSFKVANGSVRRGSKKATDIDTELQAYYFKPSDPDLKVNSDEFKVNMGVKGADGTIGIKKEYEETFGFVLNEAEGKDKQQSGRMVSTQDIAANYVQALLNGEQI